MLKMAGEEVLVAVENCASEGSEILIPNAEELESYYLMLEAGTIPELQWKFPGRLNLQNTEPSSKVDTIAPTNTVESEPPDNFDFSDDVAQPQMRVRSQNSTPKSKKKVANFAGVMEVLKKKNAEG